MVFSEWIVGRILDPFLDMVRQQWKGFVIGSILVAAILIYNYKPIVDKHFEIGTFIGTYTINKGEDVTVSRNELNIKFREQVFRKERSADYDIDSLYDSILVYPILDFYPHGRHYEDTRIKKFKIGQRYTFNSDLYSYIIELESLEEKSSDTSVTINVYRREYPKIRKEG